MTASSGFRFKGTSDLSRERVSCASKEPMGSVLRVSREAVKLRDELNNPNSLIRNLLRPDLIRGSQTVKPVRLLLVLLLYSVLIMTKIVGDISRWHPAETPDPEQYPDHKNDETYS